MAESFTFDINKLTEDFIKQTQQNNPEALDYYEEIKQFRAYGAVKDFRKTIDEAYNNFCFNNSLIHKINFNLLDDNQRLAYKIISYAFENDKTLPSNLTNRIILKYYMDNIDKNIKDVKLEDLGVLCNYWYDNIPSRYLKTCNQIEDIKSIDKLSNIQPLTNKQPNFELVKHTLDFLEIGNCLLFNVDGFPKNQLNLLLYGMAIYYTYINLSIHNHSNFKTFKELINYIKSFIQINTYSKCLDVLSYKEINEDKNEESNYYNLITYLTFKNKVYNYRYKAAEKYFQNMKIKSNGNTKFEAKADGESYIFTEYKTKDDLIKVWDELEDEFKNNGLTDKLINMWFDGQLLTRSTCLIGCILIILKEGKLIKFIKDEMPDWKSIALNTFEGTYEICDKELCSLDPQGDKNIKDLNVGNEIKLIDILYMLYNFMTNIKLNFN